MTRRIAKEKAKAMGFNAATKHFDPPSHFEMSAKGQELLRRINDRIDAASTMGFLQALGTLMSGFESGSVPPLVEATTAIGSLPDIVRDRIKTDIEFTMGLPPPNDAHERSYWGCFKDMMADPEQFSRTPNCGGLGLDETCPICGAKHAGIGR